MRRSLPFFLLIITASSLATEHGTLTIVVTDANGGFLEGASVKAVKIGDSKGVELKSDKEGTAKFDLEIGDYCITVRQDKFDPDFTGGVRCRAKSDFKLHFMLYPGDASKKLPHEKTPEEREVELAKLRAKLGDAAPKPEIVAATYKGLDDACKELGIERTNGGPAARKSLSEMAYALAKERNWAGATAKFKQALGEDPSDALCWFNLGVAYFANQQAKNTELCCRTAIGLCGGAGEPEYHQYLGRALGRMGRMEECEKSFKAAAALAPPAEGQYLYELGNAYNSMKDHAKAADAYAKAIEKKCPDPTVHFGLGMSLEMLRRNNEAIKAYNAFLEAAKNETDLADYVKIVKERLAKLQKEK